MPLGRQTTNQFWFAQIWFAHANRFAQIIRAGQGAAERMRVIAACLDERIFCLALWHSLVDSLLRMYPMSPMRTLETSHTELLSSSVPAYSGRTSWTLL